MTPADARAIDGLRLAAIFAKLTGNHRRARALLRRAWVLTLEAAAPGPVVQ